MITPQNGIVDDYLARLEAAATALPADRRTELLEEIRQHIGDALSDANAQYESVVRNVLEKLGSPADIIAAEAPLGSAAPQPASPVPDRPRPRIDRWKIAGLGLLLLAALALLAFNSSQGDSPGTRPWPSPTWSSTTSVATPQ
ncbi:HAAS signaling domain-containing protein [Kitasatospora sp. NPDC056531]|uniref:HAAS signaling domain-containing protein n=1 Tax=Kitasatospora sp. NPDC056531 TaxID=3345856 RepID=UPI0036C5C724